jgi:hypothetical protein
LVVLQTALWAKTVTVSPGGLMAGISQLQGGDTLVLTHGTYREGNIPSCVIPSGTQSQPTTLKAQTPRQAILAVGGGTVLELGRGCTQDWIVFDGLVIDKENRASGEGMLLRSPGHITFQNGEIRNFLRTGSCSPSQAFGGTAKWMTILNSHIHDIGTDDGQGNTQSCDYSYGYYLADGPAVLDGNTWEHISAFAIHGYNGSGSGVEGNILRNNFFYKTGPVLLRDGGNNQVYNNVLVDVGTTVYPYERDAFMIHGHDNQIVYNTVVRAGHDALNMSGGSGNTARNNLLWQSAGRDAPLASSGDTVSDNFCGVSASGGGCTQTGDPRFVNATGGTKADYQLTQSSGAINAGVSTPQPTTDTGGQARVQGSKPDQGAWEYGSQPVMPPQPQPSSGEASWPLNEAPGARTAADATGNGHTLALTGSAAFGAGYTSAPGLVCGATPGLAQMQGNFAQGQYTWLGWFLGKHAPNMTSSQLPLNNGGGAADLWGLHWSLGCQGCNQAVFQQDTTGTWWNVQIPGPLKADRWYWIGATYDGTLLRAWLNGHPVAAQQVPSLKSSAGTFSLCGASWGGSFLGSIDEVKVFPRALSADEMSQQYLGSVYLPRAGREER